MAQEEVDRSAMAVSLRNLIEAAWIVITAGPGSQKLGAAGTGNLEWTLIAQLTLTFRLDARRKFLILRIQLEASCATRGAGRVNNQV